MVTTSVSIEVQPPNAPAARLALAGQNLVIGRKDCSIPLDSVLISRRHAEMVKDPFGRWWIRDLGSRNGTHVNGNRITEAIIKPGDRIQIGDYALSLCPPEDSSAAALPSPDAANVNVPLVDGDAGKISTLKASEAPRLAAAHLSSLTDFGQQLLTQADHNQRLSTLCKLMVRPEFHGRSAVALRASKESFTEAPTPLCSPAAAGGYEEWSPYISRTLLRTMLARNEPALASNSAAASAALPAGVDAAELSLSSDVMAISAVAVPITSEKNHTDLLYIVFPPEFGTSEWLALAALAVKEFTQAESTWAAKRVSEDHASIERELGRAHSIQERLVPRNIQIPGVDFAIGFIPCRWVGGDYVDVVPGKDGKVLLTVADVCGKGLPAALVASSLHMMCHTAMRTGTSLPHMMQNLNVYLQETLAVGTFVTMLACLLDPAAGTLETINAGHPPGFFITPAGELSLTQSEINMPLGLDASTELISATTTLEPATTFIMYTDGLTELPLQNGELLGEAALGEHLARLVTSAPAAPTADLSKRLSALLDSLQHGMAQDDRTFLLARRM